MQNIELTGVPSETYKDLKKSIENYLSVNKLDLRIKEVNDASKLSSESIPSIPMIKYAGHILTFGNQSDIRIKLPKLYDMIQDSDQHESGKHRKCMNCDGCRCKK